MQILAIISLLSLVIYFVLNLFHTAVDPDKTYEVQLVEKEREKITARGVVVKDTILQKRIGAKLVPMNDLQKRKRFMWNAIAAMPGIIFIIVYLITL